MNFKIKNSDIVKSIRKMFEKEYTYKGMVQFDENEKPCICGISVTWLENITVKALNEEESVEKACNILNKKYPQYNDMCQLW